MGRALRGGVAVRRVGDVFCVAVGVSGVGVGAVLVFRGGARRRL